MTEAERPTRRNPHGISILLVEDHKDSAEVMARLLRAKGYSVEICATVAEAVKIANERDFNLEAILLQAGSSALVVASDGKLGAVCEPGDVRLVDLSSGKTLYKLFILGSAQNYAAFSSDAR